MIFLIKSAIMIGLEKYKCECCGGDINPYTLKCEYCGTQYKDKNERVVRVDHYSSPVRTIAMQRYVSEEELKHYSLEEVSEHVVQDLTYQIAEVIAPFCNFSVENDIRYWQKRIVAICKIVQPNNEPF